MSQWETIVVTNPQTGEQETKSVEVGLSPGQTAGVVGGVYVERPEGYSTTEVFEVDTPEQRELKKRMIESGHTTWSSPEEYGRAVRYVRSSGGEVSPRETIFIPGPPVSEKIPPAYISQQVAEAQLYPHTLIRTKPPVEYEYTTYPIYKIAEEWSAGAQRKVEEYIEAVPAPQPVKEFSKGFASFFTGLPAWGASGIVGWEAVLKTKDKTKLPEMFITGATLLGTELVSSAKKEPVKTAGFATGMLMTPRIAGKIRTVIPSGKNIIKDVMKDVTSTQYKKEAVQAYYRTKLMMKDTGASAPYDIRAAMSRAAREGKLKPATEISIPKEQMPYDLQPMPMRAVKPAIITSREATLPTKSEYLQSVIQSKLRKRPIILPGLERIKTKPATISKTRIAPYITTFPMITMTIPKSQAKTQTYVKVRPFTSIKPLTITKTKVLPVTRTKIKTIVAPKTQTLTETQVQTKTALKQLTKALTKTQVQTKVAVIRIPKMKVPAALGFDFKGSDKYRKRKRFSNDWLVRNWTIGLENL